MRMAVAGLLMVLLAAAPVRAQTVEPAPAPQPAGLAPGWHRIDAHTLRRVDVATAAAPWHRVDAHHWQAYGPGEAPRAVAAR